MLRKILALMAASLLLAGPAFAFTDLQNQLTFAPWQKTAPISSMAVFGAHATGAAVSVSMPAVAGQINYVYQAQVSCAGGTAAAAEFTLSGLAGGSLFFEVVQAQPLTLPLMMQPASAANTAVTLSGTAPSGVTCSATLEGFVL